ncbi:MAG: zf-HC2 domain-containing protein [Opitutales bacterium]|nr:zf-HC2 domain-containing protein [Opitutales bacterium]MCH8539331.1 zf-HC2 domain-containing protein [Opitutales bacterium]
MKEKRFIELLNLYLDGEIDDTEKQLLDEALQKSSERRAIFQQYAVLQKAALAASEKFKPQMRKSVDFRKYAELARNADSRIFNGFAYSAAALLFIGILFATAFRFVGESVWEAVFDSGGEAVAQVQSFRFDDTRESSRSESERSAIESAFNQPLLNQESDFGSFSERAMSRFQTRMETLKANAYLEETESDRSFSFGSPFSSSDRSYRGIEEATLANFRFQR